MKVIIKKEVFKKFHPEFRVAFILAEKVDDKTKLKESNELLKEIRDMIYLLFRKESIKSHHLISPWAVIQQEFNGKGKHHHTSLEKLLTKIIKKRKVKTSSVLINLVKYLSLKHMVPVTVDDFDKIKGSLTFGLSSGKERIKLLKGLNKNTLFYQDKKGILGKKLDFWKSSRTNPGRKTKAYLIHIEALPPVSGKKLKEIVNDLSGLIDSFCCGKTKLVILNKRKNSVEI
jgi:DNA/RNA-binding domain of Phe-tRNA-synthetase-like protein